MKKFLEISINLNDFLYATRVEYDAVEDIKDIWELIDTAGRRLIKIIGDREEI